MLIGLAGGRSVWLEGYLGDRPYIGVLPLLVAAACRGETKRIEPRYSLSTKALDPLWASICVVVAEVVEGV